MPTAQQIDKACREGFFVFVGNRQQVWGAQSALTIAKVWRNGKSTADKPEVRIATKGKVWVSLGDSWEQVEQGAVVITTEPFNIIREKKEIDMPRGAAVKRASKRALPGMDDIGIDEIESAGAVLLEIEGRKKATRTEYDNQEQVVITVMKKHDKDFYKHDGLEISLNQGKTKVKVKHKETPDAE